MSSSAAFLRFVASGRGTTGCQGQSLLRLLSRSLGCEIGALFNGCLSTELTVDDLLAAFKLTLPQIYFVVTPAEGPATQSFPFLGSVVSYSLLSGASSVVN